MGIYILKKPRYWEPSGLGLRPTSNTHYLWLIVTEPPWGPRFLSLKMWRVSFCVHATLPVLLLTVCPVQEEHQLLWELVGNAESQVTTWTHWITICAVRSQVIWMNLTHLVQCPASGPLRKVTEVKVPIVTKFHFLLKKKKKGSVTKASWNYLIFFLMCV